MNFLEAIESRDEPTIRNILAETTGIPHILAVHFCARFNMPDTLDELVARGADVNAIDDDGRTPLHWAAYNSCPQPVHQLIHHGADLNPIDNYGFSPAVYAIRERTPQGEEILAELLAAGANYDLHAAVSRPDIGRVREILRIDGNAVRSFVNQEQLLIDALIGLEADYETDASAMLEALFTNGLNVRQELIEDLSKEYGDEISSILREYERDE